ncbi:protein-L-isoaspartate(D-aspartate) O-methyltransferase, partial [bacterium]|nr:protein-L-isoaspartate(D-aspartate) O-methyltransferase [bacterium]
MSSEHKYRRLREQMVTEQMVARGICDTQLLATFREIPRELFISPGMRNHAYSDRPVPIGYNQTISQPYMVALMTAALELQPRHRVLEIGTGSGYQAAILSRLVERIYTIERVAELTVKARAVFELLEMHNIVSRSGDGTIGWSEFAPFDRIVVTAGAPAAPPTLLRQLTDGGRLVIPVGTRREQTLRIIVREGDSY